MMLSGLERWSEDLGVTLDERQAGAMRKYWDLVLRTNEHTNLTRITEDEDATIKHFIDSLSVLETGVFRPGARVADVGTGAGFPGIPLKIARPDLQLTLIDSALKRVRFLEETVEALGWDDVQVVHGRAETVSGDRRFAGRFDVVVARAVARLDKLAHLCLPLVREGGYFIAMKGPEVKDEVKEAQVALRDAGARVERFKRLQLPKNAGRRTLVVVAKRRAGVQRQDSVAELKKNDQIAWNR